jgi:hypothetical protein
MEAVELAMEGFTNRQKVALNALCRGDGIKAFASPATDEELDKVLAHALKLRREAEQKGQ